MRHANGVSAARIHSSADLPKGFSGVYGASLPYTSFDDRSAISLSDTKEIPMRSYLIAAGLASSLLPMRVRRRARRPSLALGPSAIPNGEISQGSDNNFAGVIEITPVRRPMPDNAGNEFLGSQS
jgi:hypothetical protein